MKTKIIVLNGYPRSGKDEFVKIASKKYKCFNYSSINKTKEIAVMMGWDGKKTHISRKMLSELKDLYTKWFNGPFKDFVYSIENELNHIDFVFVHVREPKEIDKIKRYCENNEISFNSILIKRNLSEKNHTSHSDQNINNYKYNIEVLNNGSLYDYKNKIINIMNCI